MKSFETSTDINLALLHIRSTPPGLMPSSPATIFFNRLTNKPVDLLYIPQPYLFFIINDHLCIPCLADIFSFMYLWQYLQQLYIYACNANEVLSWQSQIFYICKLYLFFYIYDPFLHIPSLAAIFVFCKCHWVFTTIYNDSTLCNHICSFTSMTIYGSLVWQTYNNLFLFYVNIFKNCTHMCICTKY